MKIYTEIPETKPITPLLDKVNFPSDLRSFSSHELKQLADELREFLLYSVGISGGHLGSGLGVVELTVVYYTISLTRLRIILYGMWVIKHIPIKFLQEERIR